MTSLTFHEARHPIVSSRVRWVSTQILHLGRFSDAQFSAISSQMLSLPETGRGNSPPISPGKARGIWFCSSRPSPLHRRSRMEPHPTLGASDTGLRPGSEATQIVLCKVLSPSSSDGQACNGGESRFQLHDLGSEEFDVLYPTARYESPFFLRYSVTPIPPYLSFQLPAPRFRTVLPSGPNNQYLAMNTP